MKSAEDKYPSLEQELLKETAENGTHASLTLRRTVYRMNALGCVSLETDQIRHCSQLAIPIQDPCLGYLSHVRPQRRPRFRGASILDRFTECWLAEQDQTLQSSLKSKRTN